MLHVDYDAIVNEIEKMEKIKKYFRRIVES